MSQVITALFHRALDFRDRKGDEHVRPSRSRQRVSAHIASHPYFLAAMISEWVTDVEVVDVETGESVPLSEYQERQKPRKTKG